MKSILVLSVIAALGLIASVPATEHCARNRAVYQIQTYAAPVQYVQKAAVAQVYKDVVLKPYAVEVVKSPDYYYSVDSYFRDKLLVDALAGRIQQMQAAGQLLSPQMQGPLAPPQQSPQVTVPTNEFQDAKVLAVMKAHCARCHSSAKSEGNLVLVTDDGRLAAVDSGKAWQCFGLATSGEMPKGSKPISDEETKVLYEWAKATGARAKK
jgi:mono/diheme cytochrome c family protein